MGNLLTEVILLGIIYILNNEYEKEGRVKEEKIADEKEKEGLRICLEEAHNRGQVFFAQDAGKIGTGGAHLLWFPI